MPAGARGTRERDRRRAVGRDRQRAAIAHRHELRAGLREHGRERVVRCRAAWPPRRRCRSRRPRRPQPRRRAEPSTRGGAAARRRSGARPARLLEDPLLQLRRRRRADGAVGQAAAASRRLASSSRQRLARGEVLLERALLVVRLARPWRRARHRRGDLRPSRDSRARPEGRPARTRRRTTRLDTPSTGASAGKSGRPRPRSSVKPRPVESAAIESAVQSANSAERRDRERLVVDRRQQQDADARAAAHPVHEADPVGLQRRARAPAAGWRVRVEGAAVPAQEQRDRERDDHEADRRLRCLLHRLGQVALEEHDRQPEGEQGRRVAEAPGRARAGRPRRWRARACRRSASRRRRGGRGRSRGGGRARSRPRQTSASVAPSENDAIQVVESEHGQLTFGTARTVMASPAARMTSALAAGKSRTSRPSKLTRAERAFGRATAARPMPVMREREARAEGDDQQQPEGDPVQRDRREQDDERGRAGKQAAGDADGEAASGSSVPSSPWWW